MIGVAVGLYTDGTNTSGLGTCPQFDGFRRCEAEEFGLVVDNSRIYWLLRM